MKGSLRHSKPVTPAKGIYFTSSLVFKHIQPIQFSKPYSTGSTCKTLFTPGPLSTAPLVRQALLKEYGSREPKFLEIVKGIRTNVLKVGGFSSDFDVVIMQGSGTMAVEAVVSTVVPKNGKILTICDGAYGKRIFEMTKVHQIPAVKLEFGEEDAIDIKKVEECLMSNEGITHLSVIHSETTTGKINDVGKLAKMIAKLPANKRPSIIVDAMSSFGGVDIDFQNEIDYLITSANKCIEGVPGFGLVIARKEAMKKSAGNARTLSLDFISQWKSMEETGQFRYTPPTHVLVGFSTALDLLQEEGGVKKRMERYKNNQKMLLEGMGMLGFKTLLDPSLQGHIITSFLYPEHKNWNWEKFYNKLYDRGFVLYPGKLTNKDCFRIGTIGALNKNNFTALLKTISEVKQEMGF